MHPEYNSYKNIMNLRIIKLAVWQAFVYSHFIFRLSQQH